MVAGLACCCLSPAAPAHARPGNPQAEAAAPGGFSALFDEAGAESGGKAQPHLLLAQADAPAAPAGAGKAEGSAAEGKKKTQWKIPPIRIGGRISEQYEVRLADDQPKTRRNSLTAMVKAATYIWQPWFAKVNGSIGTTLDKTMTGPLGPTKAESTSSATDFWSANLSLLPRSRFPFEAYVSVNDISTTGVGGSEALTTNFGVRQSYTPRRSPSNYTVSFDRILRSGLEGNSSQGALRGTMTTKVEEHALFLNAAMQRDRQATGLKRSIDSLTGTHQYITEDEVFTFSDLGNISHTNDQDRDWDNVRRLVQVSNFTGWEPDTERPLRGAGSVRLLSEDSHLSSSLTGRTSHQVIANGNVDYDPIPDVRVSATVNLNARKENGTLFTTGSESGTISHLLRLSEKLTLTSSGTALVSESSDMPEILVTRVSERLTYQDNTKLGEWGYSLRASGLVSHQATFGSMDTGGVSATGGTSAAVSLPGTRGATTTGNRTVQVGKSATHTLFRVFASGASLFNVRLMQGATANTPSNTQTLTHGATLTWVPGMEAGTASVVVNATDTRNFSREVSGSQLLNVQGNVNGRMGRFATLQGGATFQISRTFSATAAQGYDTSTGADITYVNARFFGVPRMRFSSSLRVNMINPSTDFTATDAQVQNQSNQLQNRTNSAWENRLDYRLGLLSLSAQAHIARVDGKGNKSILFKVSRSF